MHFEATSVSCETVRLQERNPAIRMLAKSVGNQWDQTVDLRMQMNMLIIAHLVQQIVIAVWVYVVTVFSVVSAFIELSETYSLKKSDWEKQDTKGRVLHNLRATARNIASNEENVLRSIDDNADMIDSLLKFMKIDMSADKLKTKVETTVKYAKITETATSTVMSTITESLEGVAQVGKAALAAIMLPFQNNNNDEETTCVAPPPLLSYKVYYVSLQAPY